MTAPISNGGLRHQIATQCAEGVRHARQRIRVCTEEIRQMHQLIVELETAQIGLGVMIEPAPVSPMDPRD